MGCCIIPHTLSEICYKRRFLFNLQVETEKLYLNIESFRTGII